MGLPMADTPRLPWFRVYSEILDDRKIERVCKMTSNPKATVIGVWVTLLALANDSPDRGRLCITLDIPVSMGDLCSETGLPQEELYPIIEAFHDLGMLNGDETMAIKNWDKRQFRSDSSTDRVRRYRDNVTVDIPAHETLQKRSSNALDTDTDTDTESEEEPQKPAAPASSPQRIVPDKILCDASGLSAFPGDQRHWHDVVYSLAEDHGVEATTKAMRQACDKWVATLGKNGRTYRKTNLNWIGWAQEILAGGSMDAPPKSTKDMTDDEFRVWLLSQEAENGRPG